jgi:hypothetical protein
MSKEIIYGVSEKEFLEYIEYFLINNEIKKKREWRKITKDDKIYLLKIHEENILIKEEISLKNIQNDSLEEEYHEDIIENIIIKKENKKNTTIKYEYHILYNEVYLTPCLYFRIYKNNKLLNYDEIFDFISYNNLDIKNKYTFITQTVKNF